MTVETNQPYLISLEDAACRRLERVEKISIARLDSTTKATIALPASYPNNKKKAYPLLIALDAGQNIGSLIEMSRLMGETKEVHECIIVGLNGRLDDFANISAMASWLEQQVIPWCQSNYRVAADEIAIFGVGELAAVALQVMLLGSGAASAFIISNPDTARGQVVLSQFQKNKKLVATKAPRLALTSQPASQEFCLTLETSLKAVAQISMQKLQDTVAADMGIPAAVHGLRSLWRTNIAYGKGVGALRAAWVPALLGVLSPLIRLLTPTPKKSPTDNNPYLIHAKAMKRDFEIFVSLPRSLTATSGRRYPTLFVFDANIEFATVAEAAASMAAAGLTEETIIVGIGVPRAEGAKSFAFRRFEEFSPPTDGYDYSDDLGRIFRSLFSINGQVAREQLGRAPQFLRFIVDELLSQLSEQYPIDHGNLGVLGHSAGGTFVLYALSQANSPFKHYAAVSPGLAVSGSWLLNRDDAIYRANQNAKSLFLSLGSEEKSNLFNIYAGIDKTEAFAERLRHSTSLSVKSMCFENETHSSTYPRAVINALSAAFPRVEAKA